MSRLVDYMVIVSYGSGLEVIDPSEFHSSLMEVEAKENAEKIAAVGGAGGAKEVEPSMTRLSGSDSDGPFVPTALSPIAASPMNYSATPSHNIESLNQTFYFQPQHLSPSAAIQLPRSSPSSSGSLSPSSSLSGSSSSPSPSPAPHRIVAQTTDLVQVDVKVATDETLDELVVVTISACISSFSSSSVTMKELQSSSSAAADQCDADADADDQAHTPIVASSSPSSGSYSSSAASFSSSLPARSPLNMIVANSNGAPLPALTPSTPAPHDLLSFTERIYRAQVVDRFPDTDHRSVPFPPGIAMFCIPDDITLAIVPALPTFYFFGATGANGVRLYGSCLKFFEPLSEEMQQQVWKEEKRVQENKKRFDAALPFSQHPRSFSTYDEEMHEHASRTKGKKPVVYASKCICLLSTYAFLRPFREFLTELYRASLTPSPVPIERIVCNFMTEVALPPMGELKVQYSINDRSITFARPPPNNPFGFHQFPIRFLFHCLDFSNVLLLFECMLAEKRILLLSDKLSVLTIVSETLLSLMYPFVWSHVYIPLLPKSLADFLHAPMPFLIGTHSSYVPIEHLRQNMLDEMVVVRLDNNSIEFIGSATNGVGSPRVHTYPPQLPAKQRKKLWKKMKLLHIYQTGAKGELILSHSSKSTYEQKLFQNIDLAFSNAPLPTELEAATNSSGSSSGSAGNKPSNRGGSTAEEEANELQKILNEELDKNQNYSPKSREKHRKNSLKNASASATENANTSSQPAAHSMSAQKLYSSGLYTTSNNRTKQQTKASSQSGGMKGMTSPSALANGMRGSSDESDPVFQLDESDPANQSSPAPFAASMLDSDLDSIDYLICSAFFRVFVSLFKDYRPFLIFPTVTHPFPDPCFELNGFLKVQENGGKGNTGIEIFVRSFAQTMAFRRFIEERTFPITSKDQQKRLIFFEESIMAKRNRSKFTKKLETPFLKDRSLDICKTFVAPSPDLSNLPLNASFVYPVFPSQFNRQLFTKARIGNITSLFIQRAASSGGGSSVNGHHRHQSSMLIHKNGISFGSWQPKRVTPSDSNTSSIFFRSKSSTERSLENSIMVCEQIVSTLWFILFTAITGENKQKEALDTAFQVLINMRNNGVKIQEEIFPCFMFACGNCNVPERAIDVLREMNNCGFQPDSNTFAALLQVFTMNGASAEVLASFQDTRNGTSKKKEKTDDKSKDSQSNPVTGGVLEKTLKRELSRSKSVSLNKPAFQATIPHPAFTSAAIDVNPPTANSEPLQPLYMHPPSADDPSSPCLSPQPLKITEIKEEERVKMFQLQFEMIFTGLEIHTEESCPECEKKIEDHDIRLGWTHSPNDYTTCCPQCRERFVPRFKVISKPWRVREKSSTRNSSAFRPSNSVSPSISTHHLPSTQMELLSPDSLALFLATKTLAHSAAATDADVANADLQGEINAIQHVSRQQPSSATHTPRSTNTAAAEADVAAPAVAAPLLLEYLSPAVLKKEVTHLLEVRPARYFTSKSFRKNSPALFWNLMWHFSNQCLPVDFLIRKEKLPSEEAELSVSSKSKQHQQARPNSGSSHAANNSLPSIASTVDDSTGNSYRIGNFVSTDLDSPSSAAVTSSSTATSPVDDYERVIARTRALGLGKTYGYGVGAGVAGAGAAGIFSFPTQQQQRNYHDSALEDEDTEDTADEETDSAFHTPRRHSQTSSQRRASFNKEDDKEPSANDLANKQRVVTFHETAENQEFA